MSYICAKFRCDTTIIRCNTCIFHVCFLDFSTKGQMFQQNDVIIFDVTVSLTL